jgi:hypothetical protein
MAANLDKRQKKRLEAARKKLAQLKQLLAGARSQMDDPQEPVRIEREIAAVEQQIAEIQGS